MADHMIALWDALLAADEPVGWRSAPVIDCWSLFSSPNEREVAVAGVVVGSKKFDNGDGIRTSALRALDADHRFVITQNSVYQLGWPARAGLQEGADPVWPPVLCTAACSNWADACDVAQHYTGMHTLPDAIMSNLAAAGHDDGSWEERRGACRAIADELIGVGRKLVAESWIILSADLRLMRDRNSGNIFVMFAAEQAPRMRDRACTVHETLAANGWRLLASMDDHQVGKLPQEGVSIDDPIAAARKIASIASRADSKSAGSFLDDLLVDPDPEPEPPAEQPGVVVLKELGGIETSWASREVKAAVAAILGKRLPLRAAPDPATIRRVLAAEFPYAEAAIDVMLSDLVGARYARFRSSVLVGAAGVGKSRLAMRIANLAGLHIHFYEASGASDNSFGGTARRWSTGEPATPVLAMIAAKAANAVILIDELDKASGGSNGRLWDALLPYLDPSTAARVGDPYLHAPIDCSNITYIATANDETVLPGQLRDRLRIIRIPTPTAEDLPALCRGIVADLARESGSDPRLVAPLNDEEIYIALKLWHGNSIRRLREIVARIVVRRAEMWRRH